MSIKINFEDKNVLITGANGDIGYKIVLKYLESGAKCICLDNNFKKLKKLKNNRFISKKLIFLKINLLQKNLIKNLVRKLSKDTKIDILINNAGFTKSNNFINYRL